jgi:outer membrane protein
MALATHEDVLVAAEGIRRARSDVGKATSSMLPKITAEGRYTRYSEEKSAGGFLIQPDDATRFELKASQSLFSGGKFWSARREAMINAEGSRVSHALVQESIMLDTARAYYGLLKAAADVEIKEAAAKRTVERLRVAEARYNVGEVTKAAVLRAEAEAAGAKAELIGSKSLFVDAENLLGRYVGANGPFAVEKPPVEGWAGMKLSDFLALAFENRKDYRVSELGEMAASEGVRKVRGDFFPTLTAEGTYEWRDQSPKTTFFQKESVSGALVLSYPIFEGLLRRSELSGARSVVREAALKRLSLKRDIEVEVKEAYNRLKTLDAVIDSLKKMVAFATEDYRMVFEQFKFGVASTVDVIDSDANLVSAEMSLMRATYDLEFAKLTLKGASGILLDDAPNDGRR